MNKTELLRSMAHKSGLTQKDCDKALSGFIESIKEALANGDNVALIGFGTFSVQERAARTGRNPSTGAEINIAATKAPKFSAGLGLKQAIPQPEAVVAKVKKEPKKSSDKKSKATKSKK